MLDPTAKIIYNIGMKRVQKSKESESTPSVGARVKSFLIKNFFIALLIGVAF